MKLFDGARGVVRRFVRDQRGNVAMLFGLGALALALVVGFGIDIHHQATVRDRVQESLDAAILAAASSTAETDAEVEQVIQNYLDANLVGVDVDEDYALTVVIDDDRIDADIAGRTPNFFAGLVGQSHFPVNVDAGALRGGGDTVELVLVLDNTWSMSEQAGGGQTRIQALRQAARALVNGIMIEDAPVRVSIVPYADYVNVGTSNRNAPWMNVPADYTTDPAPRVCETRTTRRVCTGPTIPRTCTRYVDGVPETYSCPDTSQQVCDNNAPVPPYQHCTGGGTGTRYTWFGCVGSRNVGALRRTDQDLSVRYPGYLGSSQACLNPIIPLTDNRGSILSAIDGLIINIGTGYRPLTYIPSGLIWGVNMLSPTAPFTEGAPYDDDVRKIIVLMTDGANTLQYRASDGRHVTAANSTNADADVRAICAYAKSLDIQIYTVGLAVPAGAPRTLMRDCATSEADAYDAADASELLAAFEGIARSINAVRLVQ